MTKSLAILFLILPLLLSHSHACIHDKIQKEIRPYPGDLSDSSSDRILTTGTTGNIRIAPFYFLDNVSDRIQTTISEQIMPAVISYYQAALQVKRLTSKIGLINSAAQWCADVDSPSELQNGVSADLVLLITATSDPDESYIAAASSCYYNTPGDFRPLVGHVVFNIAYGFSDDTEFNFQNQVYTTLHEVGHVLGFSSSLYRYYINPNTNTFYADSTDVVETITVNDVSVTVLKVEPLRTKLRDYFGCPTLEGAYIEQQGGSGSVGSHFERRVFMNELMTATSTTDTRITEFFLALLESTGWYTVDYSMAEPIFWGKGLGCDFLNTKCLDSSLQTAFPTHYCTTLDVDRCTFSNEAYAVCGTNYNSKSSSLNSAFNYWGDNTVVLDSFADNCPYYYAYTQTECKDASNTAINLPGGEYFGEGSNCFTGTLGSGSRSPFCLKNTCQEVSSGVYNIIVTVGSSSVTCTAAGTIKVPGYAGTLTCPDPATFCGTSGAVYCPRGCMGRGTCSNGVCTCNAGYFGDDCAQTGEVTFSGVKERYTSPATEIKTNSTSTTKIITYAAIGIGAGIIVVIAAFAVTVIKRRKIRREAVRRQAEKQAARQARRNNYAANGANSDRRRSSRAQRADPNPVDPSGININVAQQPIQMAQMYQQQQQYYANPQIQGNVAYYANNYPGVNNNNNGMYYGGDFAPQNQYVHQYAVQQQPQPQPQEGHRVRIPNDS